MGDTLGGRSVLRVGCKRPACVEELPTAVESGWSKNQSVMLSQSGMMINNKKMTDKNWRQKMIGNLSNENDRVE